MSKRQPPRPKGSTAPSTADAAAEIAALDAQIAQLLQKRAVCTVQAAQQPAESPPVAAPGLDEAAVERAAAAGQGPLSDRCVQAVFRELISGCRALTRQPRIAFLGPLYSYSHLAVIQRFGQSVEYVPVSTIAAVFEEVSRGDSDYGLAPIENSTDGRIADSLDMFARLPLKIGAMVEMRIHHALLGKCLRSEVQEVYSKPQAISQCRNWLARHLPGARMIEVTSTTTAAQLAQEKPGAAAIASVQAGVHYGLGVLAERIEDNPDNVTRFAIIGGEAPPRTGQDRTAMLFQVEHRPGALAEAMNVFKRNQVNLTWIESFPIPGSDRTYLFFVEMEGHQADARLRKTVQTLQAKAVRLEILGSFPKPTIVE